MSARVMVLGAGRIGSAIACDLAADYSVTVADIDEHAAQRLGDRAGIGALALDLTDPSELQHAVADQDLVVGALPGHLGYAAAQHVIGCDKQMVDISFFAEDAFGLDELAKQHGVTVVVDCGVAPGLSSLILGHHMATMDEVTSFECLVGGLPEERVPPWEYQAPFSPIDVIEGYTRPARLVRGGAIVTRPPLADVELVEFPEIGALEAFTSDGLRTLLTTSRVPHMTEKTLRYPGHVAKIGVLRDAGLFGVDPISVGSATVRPIDVTSRLLFDQWHQEDGDRDLTVMRIVIDGKGGGNAIRVQYDMLDRYDEQSGTTSMARTTGYTCAAVARLVEAGRYERPGISPPEFVGREEECYRFVMAELENRGIRLQRTKNESPA